LETVQPAVLASLGFRVNHLPVCTVTRSNISLAFPFSFPTQRTTSLVCCQN